MFTSTSLDQSTAVRGADLLPLQRLCDCSRTARPHKLPHRSGLFDRLESGSSSSFDPAGILVSEQRLIQPSNQPRQLCLGYAQAVGRPSLTNRISSGVQANLTCQSRGSSGSGSGSGSSGSDGTGGSGSPSSFVLETNPSSVTITQEKAGSLTVSVAPIFGSINEAVALSCSGLL